MDANRGAGDLPIFSDQGMATSNFRIPARGNHYRLICESSRAAPFVRL